MKKYMKCTVKIAPINSSETARVLYYEPRVAIENIPENRREVIRWIDFFEDLGVDFNEGTCDTHNLRVYDLGYGAHIEYDPVFNTGIIKYQRIGDYRSELMLRRENYFMIVEYEEVFPTLKDLFDVPLDEVAEYINYVMSSVKNKEGITNV